MKISDISSFKTSLQFYQSFLFYEKNLNSSLFFENFEIFVPPTLYKGEEGSNYEVFIFLFSLCLNAVKFGVKATATQYRGKNRAAQFCTFTTKMKEYGNTLDRCSLM